MTINQLKIQNLAPRGIRGTCVPTSICFVTGVSYQDVEYLLVREQPKLYRPEIRGNRGVDTGALLGRQRTMFGHRFILVPIEGCTLMYILSKFSVGTYLVHVNGHVLVVKDGEVYDLVNTNMATKVVNVWKVEKVS
jgi:hypothetical protein